MFFVAERCVQIVVGVLVLLLEILVFFLGEAASVSIEVEEVSVCFGGAHLANDVCHHRGDTLKVALLTLYSFACDFQLCLC